MGFWNKLKAIFGSKSEPLNSESNPSGSTESPSIDSQSVSQNQSVELSEMTENIKEFVSGTMEEVREQGNYLWNEAKEKIHEVDLATREYREKLADKATEVKQRIENYVDDTLEKAEKLNQEEKAKDTDGDGFADQPIDFGKSTEESQSRFFKKAEQWLENNDSKSNNPSPSSEESDDTNASGKMIHPLELPKDPE